MECLLAEMVQRACSGSTALIVHKRRAEDGRPVCHIMTRHLLPPAQVVLARAP